MEANPNQTAAPVQAAPTVATEQATQPASTPVTDIAQFGRMLNNEYSVAQTSQQSLDGTVPAPTVADTPVATGTESGVTTEAATEVNFFLADAPDDAIPVVETPGHPPAVSPEFMGSLASQIGLENAPTDATEFAESVRTYIQGIRASAGTSEYQGLQQTNTLAEQQLALAQDELVFVELKTTLGSMFDDNKINELIDGMSEVELARNYDAAKAKLTAMVEANKAKMTAIETQGVQAERDRATADAAEQAKQKESLTKGIAEFKVNDKPLPPKTQEFLLNYALSGKWFQDIVAQIAEGKPENFIRAIIHGNPVTGKMFMEAVTGQAAKSATSDFIKNNLEGAALQVGQGAHQVTGTKTATAQQFAQLLNNQN